MPSLSVCPDQENSLFPFALDIGKFCFQYTLFMALIIIQILPYDQVRDLMSLQQVWHCLRKFGVYTLSDKPNCAGR